MSNEPTAERPYMPGYGVPSTIDGVVPWSWALERLNINRDYWLATVRPDGRPHLVPVWGVWLEGEFFFSSGAEARKAKNLRANPHCTLSIENCSQPVMVEGTARHVTDRAELQSVCAPYEAKYAMAMHVIEDGISDADGNGGPVFAIRPVIVFGMPDMATATRWRFNR